MKFWIKCNPPRSTAQSSKRIAVIKGGGVRMYTDAKGKALQNDFMCLLQPYVPAKPYEGPLKLWVWYCLPLLKNEKKAIRDKGWAWHDRRPDGDNLMKLFQDIMGRLGFWNDDSQVVFLSIKKYRSKVPGIGVSLSHMDDLESGPLGVFTTWLG